MKVERGFNGNSYEVKIDGSIAVTYNVGELVDGHYPIIKVDRFDVESSDAISVVGIRHSENSARDRVVKLAEDYITNLEAKLSKR